MSMEEPGNRSRPLIPLGIRRSLATLGGAYIVTLCLVLAVTLLFLPESEGRTPRSSVRLFGLFGNVLAGTDLHVIQAAIILVLLGLVYLAAKLANKKYVYRWTYAWLSLFLYYFYHAIAGFEPGVSFFQAGGWAEVAKFLLFAASSLFVLLTGLQIELAGQLSRKSEALIGGALLACLFAPTPILARALGDVEHALSMANASLACVVTIFAGWELSRESKSAGATRRIPGGSEVFPLFLAYGVLQLGAAWLEGARWNTLLYSLALVLKVPCSLSVVAIALQAAFRESESREGLLEKRGEKLAEALESVDRLRELERSRTIALDRVNQQLSQAVSPLETLTILLEAACEVAKASCGIALIPAVAGPEDASLFSVVEVRGKPLTQARVALRMESSLDELGPAERAESVAGAVRREFSAAGSLFSAFEVKARAGLGSAWIVIGLQTEAESRVPEILGEILRRGEAAFELNLLRDLSALDEELRQESNQHADLRTHLNNLAMISAQRCDAETALLDVSDSRAAGRYFGYYSRNEPASPRPPSRDVAYVGPREARYPARPEADWRYSPTRIEPWRGDGERQIPENEICVPAKNPRGLDGAITCEGGWHPIHTELRWPFTRLDALYLDRCSEAMAASVEKALRRQNIERLVAENIHEFRQAVSSLKNIIHWLGKTLTPKTGSMQWMKLSDAKTDVITLEGLVDHVDFYQEGSIEVAEQVRVFKEIVNKAAAHLRERLERFGVPRNRQDISFKYVYVMPTLEIERSLLQHIVLNLVDNAFKYRDRHATRFRAEFECDVNDKFYMIRVRDWGIGIPSGWEEKIFLENQRAPNAANQTRSGTGMGLPIARSYARKVGGDIKLVSRKNPTEFVVQLPKKLRSPRN